MTRLNNNRGLQQAAAREFLALASRYAPVVQRIYYYDWTPTETPDTMADVSLASWQSVTPHLLRPAYCVFVPLATCAGSPSVAPPSPPKP